MPNHTNSVKLHISSRDKTHDNELSPLEWRIRKASAEPHGLVFVVNNYKGEVKKYLLALQKTQRYIDLESVIRSELDARSQLAYGRYEFFEPESRLIRFEEGEYTLADLQQLADDFEDKYKEVRGVQPAVLASEGYIAVTEAMLENAEVDAMVNAYIPKLVLRANRPPVQEAEPTDETPRP